VTTKRNRETKNPKPDDKTRREYQLKENTEKVSSTPLLIYYIALDPVDRYTKYIS